jgi:hypothetical protein
MHYSVGRGQCSPGEDVLHEDSSQEVVRLCRVAHYARALGAVFVEEHALPAPESIEAID